MHVIVKGLLMQTREGVEVQSMQMGMSFVQAMDGVRKDGVVVNSGLSGAELRCACMARSLKSGGGLKGLCGCSCLVWGMMGWFQDLVRM